MADQEDQPVVADSGVAVDRRAERQGPFINGVSMLAAVFVLLVGILATVCTTQVRSLSAAEKAHSLTVSVRAELRKMNTHTSACSQLYCTFSEGSSRNINLQLLHSSTTATGFHATKIGMIPPTARRERNPQGLALPPWYRRI